MKVKIICVWTFILVGIDQLIKLIIDKFYLHCEFEIIPSILDFKPTFYYKYFYINYLFDLGYGFWMYIVGCIVGIVIMLMIGSYYKRKKEDSFILSLGLTMSLAGMISGMICAVFWNGTLDYLYFKPYFVFDLKDVYLNSFLPCFIIHTIIQYKKTKKTSNFLKVFSFK